MDDSQWTDDFDTCRQETIVCPWCGHNQSIAQLTTQLGGAHERVSQLSKHVAKRDQRIDTLTEELRIITVSNIRFQEENKRLDSIVTHTLENETRDQREIRKLKRRIEKMKAARKLLSDLTLQILNFAEHGDYSNGNEEFGTDEGRYRTWEALKVYRAAVEAALEDK